MTCTTPLRGFGQPAATVATGLLALALVMLARPHEIVRGFVWYLSDDFIPTDAYQHVAPFLSIYLGGALEADLYARYYLGGLSPGGFAVGMEFLSGYFDPRDVAKAVTCVAYATTGLCVGLIGWRLGRAPVALAAVALFLACDAIFAFLVGGFPRTFGYPLFALFLVGLVYGRPFLMAAATLVGFAFYYLTGVVCLVCFALFLALPGDYRGRAEKWGIVPRGILLLVVAALCVGIYLGTEQRGDFGPRIGPDRYAEFPESGPEGRFFPGTQNIVIEAADQTVEAISGAEPNVWIAHERVHDYATPIGVACLLLIGWMVVLDRGRRSVMRGVVPFGAAAIMFGLSEAFFPRLYFPVRYFETTLPLLVVVFLPWALCALATRTPWLGSDPRRVAWATLVPLVIAVALVGGRSPDIGMSAIPEETKRVHRALTTLPAQSIVAGWPKGVVDGLPYHAERQILIGFETHQTFHEEYALEMRKRMLAVIDALYSADLAAAESLRDDFGVTHIVVEPGHYRDLPAYFQPFEAYLATVRARNPETPAVLRYEGPAKIYEDDSVFILDVAKLSRRD